MELERWEIETIVAALVKQRTQARVVILTTKQIKKRIEWHQVLKRTNKVLAKFGVSQDDHHDVVLLP